MRSSSKHLGVTLLQPVRACAVACCKDGHLQQQWRTLTACRDYMLACIVAQAPCAASCRSRLGLQCSAVTCVMPSACACLTMSSIHEVRASTSVQAHACSCRDAQLHLEPVPHVSAATCVMGPCVAGGEAPTHS